MNRKNRIFAAFALLCGSLFAQSDDIMRVEYFHLPFSKSDNNIHRYRALLQAPVPVDREAGKYIVIGLEYRYVDINIEDPEDVFAFAGHTIGSVQQMDAYLGYTWKWNEDWRIGIKAGVKIQSTLEDSPSGDDILYETAVYAIKTNKNDSLEKPYRLTLGLTYSAVPGRKFPLPILNYYKEFQPNWTYTLGVPKTNVRHYLDDNHKNALQAFATLDNFFGNIQEPDRFVPVRNNPSNKVAENISMTNVIGGIGYEHFFTEHFLYYAYFAHTVYNNFRLEDNEGEEAYTINDENSLYFRTGLKYKF